MDRGRPHGLSRRALLTGALATVAPATLLRTPALALSPKTSLGALAAAKGLSFGASFSSYELDKPYGAQYAAMYRDDVRHLTAELELKIGILRPRADTIDFAPADRLMAFADDARLAMRGHTLIWNDNLPEWIQELGPGEVEHLLEAHIETVMERYRGRIATWDVVNEPIGPWDRLPGNLRKGAFLSALGEDYIRRAFAVARRVDPSAELVLNEAQTESADENGETFRSSFMALLRRLKDQGAEIDAIGLQCHIDTARPYDFPRFAAFVQEIANLGYRVLITEFDVNDRGLTGTIAERDRQVAAIYTSFLKAVLPLTFIRSLTLWQMADHTSWLYYDDLARAPNAKRRPRPLPYDEAFRPKPAWHALAQAFADMAPR